MPDAFKVFCIGLSRTGTTSLCQALNRLGFPSRHFLPDLFVQPEFLDPAMRFEPQIPLGRYWAHLRDREVRSFRTMSVPESFERFRAFGDLPIPLWFRQLDAKFPGSKFIYTRRNPDRWLKSMRWLWTEGQADWSAGFLNEELRVAAYGTRRYDEVALLAAWERHEAAVRGHFHDRPGDLLVIDIDERRMDWDTICPFLGVPVPSIPFPASNPTRRVSRVRKLDHWLSKHSIPYSLGRKAWGRVRPRRGG